MKCGILLGSGRSVPDADGGAAQDGPRAVPGRGARGPRHRHARAQRRAGAPGRRAAPLRLAPRRRGRGALHDHHHRRGGESSSSFQLRHWSYLDYGNTSNSRQPNNT